MRGAGYTTSAGPTASHWPSGGTPRSTHDAGLFDIFGTDSAMRWSMAAIGPSAPLFFLTTRAHGLMQSPNRFAGHSDGGIRIVGRQTFARKAGVALAELVVNPPFAMARRIIGVTQWFDHLSQLQAAASNLER